MKQTFFFYVILSPLLSFSQENLNYFIGEITFEGQGKLYNEKVFEDSFKSFVFKIDSSLTKKAEDTQEFAFLDTPTLKLYFDPRESNSIIPIIFRYQFNDITINASVLRHNKIIGNIKVIDRKKEIYDLISLQDSLLIKQNLKYRFEKYSEEPKVFKDSIKKIYGYDCFKVLIREKENRTFNGINFQYLFPDSYLYTEMYVTDKIKSIYNPIVSDKRILRKYYPLQVIRYSDLFKGYRQVLRVVEIIHY